MRAFTQCASTPSKKCETWTLFCLKSIDLSLPLNGSIDRSAPAWTTNLLDLYIETIDAFSKYDNVLAYNVGNEVVTASNETDILPYIKAAARDVKAYLCVKQSSVLNDA